MTKIQTASAELDVPGAEMLEELHRDLAGREIRLMLAGLHSPVHNFLNRSGIAEKIGAGNCFSTMMEAILAVAKGK